MFEITSLYPLFPGSNEVDQISRIHKVLGTPGPDLMQKFKSKGASHVSFDFAAQKGIGIPQLIPHASADCIDLIVKLLKYDASERISAREAMRHPYFKEARESESQKLQSESPRGVLSGSTTKSDPNAANKSLKSGFQASGKQKALDGSAKMNAVLNKALPSINAGVDDSTGKSNVQVGSLHASGDQNSGKYHNSKHLPFTNSQGIVDESSLPPIAGGGHGNSKNLTNTNDTSRSNRSLQGQQLKTKRQKKFKSNYSQDNTKKKSGEQVLRTYGLSGKSTLNSNSEFNKSDVKSGSKAGAGYSHPNRHYVAKR